MLLRPNLDPLSNLIWPSVRNSRRNLIARDGGLLDEAANEVAGPASAEGRKAIRNRRIYRRDRGQYPVADRDSIRQGGACTMSIACVPDDTFELFTDAAVFPTMVAF